MQFSNFENAAYLHKNLKFCVFRPSLLPDSLKVIYSYTIFGIWKKRQISKKFSKWILCTMTDLKIFFYFSKVMQILNFEKPRDVLKLLISSLHLSYWPIHRTFCMYFLVPASFFQTWKFYFEQKTTTKTLGTGIGSTPHSKKNLFFNQFFYYVSPYTDQVLFTFTVSALSQRYLNPFLGAIYDILRIG